MTIPVTKYSRPDKEKPLVVIQTQARMANIDQLSYGYVPCCLANSLRFLLFFTSVVLALISVPYAMSLMIVASFGTIEYLPRTSKGFHIYGVAILSSLITLLAIHGSFNRHKQSLKVVSINRYNTMLVGPKANHRMSSSQSWPYCMHCSWAPS